MEFNKKFLKDNIKTILLMSILIVVFVFINILITNNTNNSELLKKNLPINGEGKYEGIVINEIMTSNNGAVASEDGTVSDWVEIYNGNDYEVNLKNYGLSDENSKTKWAFPDITIKPNHI